MKAICPNSFIRSSGSINRVPRFDSRLKARQQRLVLIAPGGTGKTALASHLCDEAGRQRVEDLSRPLPLLALVRDIQPGDQGHGLESIIIRQLRHRYDIDLPPEALQAALRDGEVFLVLDGLDEILEPSMRRDVLAAINQFSAAHPNVAVLITTRPYPAIQSDLPGFKSAYIVPWNKEEAKRYLEAIIGSNRNSREVNRSAHELVVGLQMSPDETELRPT